MKKNMIYEYVGCFFEWSDLEKALENIEHDHLWRKITFPHITFAYMPEFVDEELFGEKILVRIIGYGNDGENEGVKVEVVSGIPKLKEAFEQIEAPHITLSVSETGKPVNTRYLNYVPAEPVELTGIYGGYDEDSGKVRFDII